MYYYLVAIFSGGKQRLISSSNEAEILSLVTSYETQKTITYRWGKNTQTYRPLEVRVYQSKEKWNKKSGIKFEEFSKGKNNVFKKFKAKVDRQASDNWPRVFIIMPIQGKKYGTQEEQRVFAEYNNRFELLVDILEQFHCVGVRIDKEYPIGQEVEQIKREILNSQFVIADLTDERPSCYFEAGFAEGNKIDVIYIASENSVLQPGVPTKIHFDVHNHINYFSNLNELKDILKKTIENNNERLLKE